MTNRLFIIIFFVGMKLWAQQRELPGIKPIDKSPKALFLVKKAKIDNDVAEPVLYPKDKHEENLKKEKIFRNYGMTEYE